MRHHFANRLSSSNLPFAMIVCGIFLCLPLRAQTDRSPSTIFRSGKPSVVLILGGNDSGNPTVQGSGFIVAQDRIVTNHHVVAGTSIALVVFSDGASSSVTGVVSDSSSKDLVILAAATGQRPSLTLGDELALQQGDAVYAIGAPEGLELTFTNGIVSGFRTLDDQFLIQSTAPIGHGSSGGPLFDRTGKVVGITSSMLSSTPGIYFSVGVGDLKRLLRTPLAVVMSFSDWAKDNPATAATGSPEHELTASAEVERIQNLLTGKKFDEARIALQPLTKSDPDNPIVHRLNGELDVRTGDLEGALRELGIAVEKSPKDALARYFYAIALFESRKYQDALGQEEESNALMPTAGDRPLLALMYYAVRNYKRAETMARTVLDSDPQDETGLDVLIGIAYHGALTQQINWSQMSSQIASTHPDDFWVRIAAGLDSIRQNKVQDAVTALRAAEDNDFPDPVAYLSLESMYVSQLYVGEANDQIKAGLEAFPDDSALLNAGMYVSLLARDNTEAERRFQALQRISPDSGTTLFAACLYYYGIGQPAKGLPYCASTVKQFPQNHTAYSNYGWAALDADQFALAFQQFNEAYKLVSDKWNSLTDTQVVDLVWGFAIADYFSKDKKGCRELLASLRKDYPSALTITGLQQMPLLWSSRTLTRIETILGDIRP